MSFRKEVYTKPLDHILKQNNVIFSKTHSHSFDIFLSSKTNTNITLPEKNKYNTKRTIKNNA